MVDGPVTVSVVVPTYNRAHTLGRALASVAAQTRAADEIIVVDDGSTDATADVLRLFPGVHVLRPGRNRGAAHARNRGIERARGRYVAFLDSDDEWLPDKLRLQLAEVEARPGVGLSCTGITVHLRNGTIDTFALPVPAPASGWTFEHFLTYPFSTSTWLCRREALLAAGLFDESLPNCEDLDLLARLSERSEVATLAAVLTVKYNQPDALDADRLRRQASLSILFSRHRGLWARTPGVAAKSSYRLANMHIDAGDMARGRVALLQAIRLQPWRLKYCGLLALSLLGRHVYQGARVALRRMLGFLR